VVTSCTTRFTFKNSAFCPHSAFLCFVWISEQKWFPYTALNWPFFCDRDEVCLLRSMLCRISSDGLNTILRSRGNLRNELTVWVGDVLCDHRGCGGGRTCCLCLLSWWWCQHILRNVRSCEITWWYDVCSPMGVQISLGTVLSPELLNFWTFSIVRCKNKG
jgi:hypothetical protein